LPRTPFCSGPFDSDAGTDDDAGTAAGFVFFLTKTPFSVFLLSFFAITVVVELGCFWLGCERIGGGLLAALTLAATALHDDARVKI
jgi:hypothetical protein